MTLQAEATAFLQAHPDITHLDAVLVDLCGNPYGKRLPRAHIEKFFQAGTPVCAAMSLVDVLGNTADPMGHGFSDGDPDAIVRPIPGRLVRASWAPGLAQVLCEPENAATGEPVWYDPRAVLKGVVERFSELGLTPVTAVELEFYFISLARGDNGEPVPAASPRTGRPEAAGKVLSLDKLDEFAPVIAAIEQACRVQNLPTSTMISEYGPGQFEINLEHCDDPVKACDDAVLLRRCITSVARAHGLDATFMSVPFPGQSGSGMHIHASLADDQGNVFDPAREGSGTRLSAAIAGLQAMQGEAMAIFAPNLNVYRRFVADNFTPVTTDWGDNNRSVAFRIPSGPAVCPAHRAPCGRCRGKPVSRHGGGAGRHAPWPGQPAGCRGEGHGQCGLGSGRKPAVDPVAGAGGNPCGEHPAGLFRQGLLRDLRRREAG